MIPSVIIRKNPLLALAVAFAVSTTPASAQSDAERIRMLEEQLQKRSAVLEAMKSELNRLKDGQHATGTALITEDLHEPVAVASAPADASANPLGIDIYGVVMADAIYDFNRVDPDWNDTLRVGTIPTTDGTYGTACGSVAR